MSAALHMGRADDVTATTTHQLYERYGRQIYAYCLHQLRSREEAEDAVQTTFLNAFRSLKGGAVTHAEQAWLYKIAQNVCTARRSSSARRLRLETPNDFDVLQETIPAQSRESAVELIGLEDALERMPENQRRAILLREWQGLSYREISEELELSQASVEMLIFRARRTLAGALEQPAEEKKLKRKVGRGLNLGSALAALKSLLTGGAAVKAVALAVAAGTISVTADAVQHTIVRPHTTAQVTRPGAKTSMPPAQAVTRTPFVAQHSAAPVSGAPSPVVVSHRQFTYGNARPAPDDVVAAVAPTVAPEQSAPAPSTEAPKQSDAPPASAPPPPTAPASTEGSKSQSTTFTPPTSSSPSDGGKKKSQDTSPAAPTVSAPAASTDRKKQPDDAKDKKRKQQASGDDPAPTVTTPVVTTPAPVDTTQIAPLAAPTVVPPANGKQKKAQDQQSPDTTPTVTTPATTTTTTPAPSDDHANGKQKKQDQQPPVVTTPVTTAATTTTAAPPPPPPPTDKSQGKGKGHGNGK